jgi:hypothetical protein
MDWKDKLSKENPRLCWVEGFNTREDRKIMIASIVEYDGLYFKNTYNFMWGKAVPLTDEEIKSFLQGE